MTFRQSEFARHYAQGKPAVKAALAAGYTQSTAETNAARLLRSPDIINEIRRQRNGLRIVTIDDIMRTMTRLMHIIDNAENPAHVLQASAQLFRYLRFQPDVWPEYPDKSDKKSDIDDIQDIGTTPASFTAESAPAKLCRGELHSPVSPPEAGVPDNPDKKPDQPTLHSSLLSIHYPPLTPEFLESVEDYALADLVRQNPIMGRILAHKYPNHSRQEESAFA